MERVIIIGCPGSGKSTFGRKLKCITDLPLFYNDKPVVIDIDSIDGTAMMSIPAFGWRPLKKRLKNENYIDRFLSATTIKSTCFDTSRRFCSSLSISGSYVTIPANIQSISTLICSYHSNHLYFNITLYNFSYGKLTLIF